MIDTRTTSILQRAPVILAVTAASYGLPLQSRVGHPGGTASRRHGRQYCGCASTARQPASSALDTSERH